MLSTYDIGSGRLNFIALGKESVGTVYRTLPQVVVLSVGWSLLALTVVFVAPATAAVFAATGRILDGDDVTARFTVRAFRRYFWRSQVVFVPFIILFDFAWLLWSAGGWVDEPLLIVGAFLAVDVLILYGYLLLYYFPLLILNDGSARETSRRSVIVSLSRVRTSLGLFIFVLSVGVMFGFTVAGFVLAGPGVLATMVLLATRYLMTNGG